VIQTEPKSDADIAPSREEKAVESGRLCDQRPSDLARRQKRARGLNRRQSENKLSATRELDELRRNGFDLSKFEPWVTAEVVSLYLGIDPATVVRYAAAGKIPAHPLPGTNKRIHWRFLISEVRDKMMTCTGPKKRTNVRDQATRI
jgi:hypothetical protein